MAFRNYPPAQPDAPIDVALVELLGEKGSLSLRLIRDSSDPEGTLHREIKIALSKIFTKRSSKP